jgi:hypothetical protein
VCLHRIETRDQWELVAAPAGVVDQDRTVSYMVPVDDQQVLPTLFVNTNRYPLHYDFLLEAFPDWFSGMTWDQYVAMIIDPAARRYFGGDVAEYIEPDGSRRFGFTVWDDPAVPSSTITEAQAEQVWRALQPRFLLGDLMFVPNSSNQRDAVESWDPPFPVRGSDSGPAYEAYTQGVGYGTVRFLALSDLAAATEAASFGWQDIVVLDEAPFDLERIVSGSVTGTRQGALSHINVRAAARGTPNCYIEAPWEALQAWEGQLVRFECGADDWSIAAATTEEAQAWWDALRPDPVTISAPDLSVDTPVEVHAVPTDTVEERDVALARYGAKGANLATLYQRIDSSWQLDALVVPFSWYDEFMRSNSWDVDGETLTFAETLDRWLADDTFLSDGAVRAERLDALRAAMLEAPVDPERVAELSTAIDANFGSGTMVRLRSSSNAEDGLEFSGAGLYDSASACVADEYDADEDGPSLCDPDKGREHTVSDALRTVWASLWHVGAWEERAWYGIDPSLVAMAVLVDTQSEDEQANIVAFTGNPSADDDRWLVEAQLGDLDVVSAEPGVFPEQELLTVADGEVTGIDRVNTSSETDAAILSDARLDELGGLLWEVQDVFPIDDPVPEGGTLMLDTECKVLSDGRLIIKQVRPFLRD